MTGFDFNLEQQNKIHRIAIQYKREARKCYTAKAYLSGCILMGAAMEALLLSAINCFPEIISTAKSAPTKKREIKHFEKWKLKELLAVANELNWLPCALSKDEEWNTANAKIGDYVDIVRQIRNLIHPVQYAKEFSRKRITKKYLDACFSIVDAASDNLSKVVNMIIEERKRRDTQPAIAPE